MIKIAPSILSADFFKMGEELKRIDKADWIHCDVMDGHFVPNITFGPKMVADIRRHTTKPLDVHLMIETPEKYIDRFIEAGSDYVVIHVESTVKADFCLERIRAAGKKCGLAISPDTSVSAFEPYIEKCDLALLMSVYPGFSGQKFIETSIDRLKQLKTLRDKCNKNCIIEMDGGISTANIAQLYALGLDVAVGGNAVFAAESPATAISALKDLCR